MLLDVQILQLHNYLAGLDARVAFRFRRRMVNARCGKAIFFQGAPAVPVLRLVSQFLEVGQGREIQGSLDGQVLTAEP